MRKAIAAVMALAMPRKPPPNAFAQAAMIAQAAMMLNQAVTSALELGQVQPQAAAILKERAEALERAMMIG